MKQGEQIEGSFSNPRERQGSLNQGGGARARDKWMDARGFQEAEKQAWTSHFQPLL